MAYEQPPNYTSYPPAPPPNGAKTPTLQIWQNVLLSPAVNTFARYRSEAELGRAILWLLLSTGIASVLNILSTTVMRSSVNMLQYLPPEMRRELLPFMGATRAPIGATLLCGIPTAVASLLLGAFIGIGLVYLVAKLLQGEGNFTQTFFLMTAASAPLTLVTAGFQLFSNLGGRIPVLGAILSLLVGVVIFGLSVYNLVLSAMAVAAAQRFSLGKGFAAILIPGAVIFLFACCVGIVIVALAGVSMDQIIRQLSALLIWGI